jgi:hypothetical protein
VLVVFLVDPQHDGPRRRGEAVWAVSAGRELPDERTTAERLPAFLALGRDWQSGLESFLASIERLR